ncbi:alpha/beta hydrolase [Aerococcaceae bacterium zg-ZUI334]|uniref:alpha/beta hydrolase n=1 Tax=Aerococcaceae bacterium zg-252 TaxID=2796928 RepID=UPI001B9AA4C5|nr:alpha/beta hydrolase [Aerococcaceae bacterium zg-ZUI334]
MYKKILTVINHSAYSIQMTHYFNDLTPNNKIILYLHGGGLIFGKRDDLPEEYMTLFLNNGYSIVTLDYLLAPESKLNSILNVLEETIQTLIDNADTYFDYHQPSFFLFGRSAGSYLALLMASRLTSSKLAGLILFYGYYTLNDANFLYPNRQFNQYLDVNENIIASLYSKEPITQEQNINRYLIYLDARKKGKWLDYLLDDKTESNQFSLTGQELSNLPPAILVHSTNDPDVPYRQSIKMQQLIKNAHLISIQGNEHDFDRMDKIKGIEIYSKVVEWLEGL